MAKNTNLRFQELEERFSSLAGQLQDSPEKEALSILHGMILDGRRSANQPAQDQKSGMTLEDVANLYQSAPPMQGSAENEGLQVGDPAPNFSLPDASGREVSLESLRGQNVLLAFYPLDWSPACSDQLSLYQSELEEFRKHNTAVLGISVDSIYSHGAWAAVRGITFPLLADFQPKGEIAKRYRVWRESDGFSERALYVVDRHGKICYKTISPELHHIPDIYELFERLEALG